MTLEFEQTPPVVPWPAWRAVTETFTFSILEVAPGKFGASAKPMGGKFNDGTSRDLGFHPTLEAAQAACAKFFREQMR